MNKTSSSSIIRVSAAILFALLLLGRSNPALCGEIHDAADNGDVEKVRSLLKSEPELVFSKGYYVFGTPLHFAARNGNKDVAELLIANGVEVNAKTNRGRTPLHFAAYDVAKLLIANKAKVNAKASDGWTPLHTAAFGGSTGHVLNTKGTELLIANGAEVNAKNYRGLTPLHVAASNGHKDVVELLIANGAKVNAKDKKGETGNF